MLPQVMRLGDSGTTEAESREVPVPGSPVTCTQGIQDP